MATPEHCLYCFDSLAAKLDKTFTPLSLPDVQTSYAAYLAHLKDSQVNAAASPKKIIPALARLTDASSSSSSLGSSSGTSSTTSLSTNTAATSTTSARERVTDPDAQYPLFVTWDKAAQHTTTTAPPAAPAAAAAAAAAADDDNDDDDEWHLRGCIGTFSADAPLADCLAEYAAIAALHDTRFHPVSRAELPRLRCAVTLLTNFEACDRWDDWVIGEHGIKIRFTTTTTSAGAGARASQRGGGGRTTYSGTYLPSVAAEQEWSKEETMLSLMRKAGWRGSASQWREVAEDPDCMQVERYRGEKEEVAFAEYQQWRDWVSEHWVKA